MKKIFLILILAGVIISATSLIVQAAPWSGVDETVIEKFAEKNGRTAQEPFINTDQGDLLLFVFLVAGIVGGFIAGYHFRTLFPPRGRHNTKGKAGKGEASVFLDAIPLRK